MAGRKKLGRCGLGVSCFGSDLIDLSNPFTGRLDCRPDCGPTCDESGREVLGTLGDPSVDEWGREKGAALNLCGREDERALMCATENPHELHAGHGVGWKRSDFLKSRLNPHLLCEFPRCCLGVSLAGVDMSSCTGIPAGRVDIFPAGSFLQEEFTFRVEDEDVDCAVAEAFRVNFVAREHGDGGVLLVHHIKHFAVNVLCSCGQVCIRVGCGFLGVPLRWALGEETPLFDRDLFCS